ncbi:MAG: hypothetical protein WDO18_10420 [Acidobacteriota bacterium]
MKLKKKGKDGSGEEYVERLFRLVRETVEWIQYQAEVFSFAFVQNEAGAAVCIMQLRELSVAVEAPWPSARGALGNPGQGERDSGMIPNGVPG